MRTSIRSAFVACCLSGLSASAFALPSFAQVLSGAANFLYDAKGLTVQTFGDTTIEWNTFDIAANEQLYFDQSQTSGWVQNVVVNNSPIVVVGKLSSNGNISLQANDITFAQGSSVSVAGLTMQADHLALGGSVTTHTFVANGTMTDGNVLTSPPASTITVGAYQETRPPQLGQVYVGLPPVIVLVSDPQIMLGVPEPEVSTLLVAGLGLLGFMARRRKQLTTRWASAPGRCS